MSLRSRLFSSLAVGILLLSTLVFPDMVSADTSTTTLASSVSGNKTRYFAFENYASYIANRPKRSENCPNPSVNGGNKALWIQPNLNFRNWITSDSTYPDYHQISYTGASNYSLIDFWGNSMASSGPCWSRFYDGGTHRVTPGVGIPGAFMGPADYGGWASNDYNDSSWGPQYPGYSGVVRDNVIWGRPGLDKQNKEPIIFSGTSTYPLYGQGVTLFRASFYLTDAQINALKAGTAEIKLDSMADDFYAAYINGYYIAGSYVTGGLHAPDVIGSAINKHLVSGRNTIAIQVLDKARWDSVFRSSSDWNEIGYGLYYKLQLVETTSDTPPPTVDVCPNLDGNQTSVPGGMVKDASGNCVDSGNKPYLSVYGGDAMAGSSPVLSAAGETSCNSSSTAGFEGWNNNGSPNYAGAGTQLAAYALGAINYFATAQNSQSTPPYGLAFSDAGRALATGKYGSSLGMTLGGCDYTSSIGRNGESVDEHTGDYTLTTQQLADGVRRTIYVKNGNAYLSGDVLYTNNSWTDVRSIPDFRLVVEGGNIYVDDSVSSLSGVYVAIPKAGTGGNIYTCTNDRLNYSVTDASYYPNCNRQLKIYGSFVAKKVYFQRTYEDLTHAGAADTYTNSKAAEVFVYTPEVWIPRTTSSDPSAIDSITGLAPIL